MKCEYRCMRCKFFWKNYRVLGGKKERGPGMTECPKCGHEYVEWVNARKFLESLGRYWEEDHETHHRKGTG